MRSEAPRLPWRLVLASVSIGTALQLIGIFGRSLLGDDIVMRAMLALLVALLTGAAWLGRPRISADDELIVGLAQRFPEVDRACLRMVASSGARATLTGRYGGGVFSVRDDRRLLEGFLRTLPSHGDHVAPHAVPLWLPAVSMAAVAWVWLAPSWVWSVPSVPLTAITAYIATGWRPGSGGDSKELPSGPMLRIDPDRMPFSWSSVLAACVASTLVHGLHSVPAPISGPLVVVLSGIAWWAARTLELLRLKARITDTLAGLPEALEVDAVGALVDGSGERVSLERPVEPGDAAWIATLRSQPGPVVTSGSVTTWMDGERALLLSGVVDAAWVLGPAILLASSSRPAVLGSAATLVLSWLGHRWMKRVAQQRYLLLEGSRAVLVCGEIHARFAVADVVERYRDDRAVHLVVRDGRHSV